MRTRAVVLDVTETLLDMTTTNPLYEATEIMEWPTETPVTIELPAEPLTDTAPGLLEVSVVKVLISMVVGRRLMPDNVTNEIAVVD